MIVSIFEYLLGFIPRKEVKRRWKIFKLKRELESLHYCLADIEISAIRSGVDIEGVKEYYFKKMVNKQIEIESLRI